MSTRSLTVLGTASQVPTIARSHNSAFLRWDNYGILFDPGEGTQRQLALAGIPASAITHICITHFHGDHCLGLPGVLQRLSLDEVQHRVVLLFPGDHAEFVDRLRRASVFHDRADLLEIPVFADGIVWRGDDVSISAAALDHRITTYGWRVQEDDGRRMLPEKLAQFGIKGPDVGVLQRAGRIEVSDRMVSIEEVSEHRPGQSAAFVMDTRPCPEAETLAQNADLLVCESTYSAEHKALAEAHAHMTSHDAATLALKANARRLVLTHFSARYTDVACLQQEAAEVFGDVVAATDLTVVGVPERK